MTMENIVRERLQNNRFHMDRYNSNNFCEGYHELMDLVMSMAIKIDSLEDQLRKR
jgi:hypothetical protein